MNISEIWAENASYVLKICERFVKDPVAAEDIRQEVFFKIISSAKDFKEQASLKTWLYSITWRCCIDYFRARKRQKQIEEECLQQGNLFLKDIQFPIWKTDCALEMPCPISQLFVELIIDEGWSTEELCAVFGFSKGYVNKKIQEGFEQLQKSM